MNLYILPDYRHACCQFNLLVFICSVDQVADYEHPCLEDVLCVPQGFLWHPPNDEFLNHKCATKTLKRGEEPYTKAKQKKSRLA